MRKINPIPELTFVEQDNLVLLYRINNNMQSIHSAISHNIGMSSHPYDLKTILEATESFIDKLNIIFADGNEKKDMGCNLADC